MASSSLGTTSERFWAKVVCNLTTGCWLWTGSRNNKGYGQFNVPAGLGVKHRPHGAHRVAWFLTYGEWAPDDVLHRCDHPLCVRPEHLFRGTARDNMRDASAKGRIFNQRKTHCPAGHPYDPENTRGEGGHRLCRTCQAAHNRAYRQRVKEGTVGRVGRPKSSQQRC